MTAPTSRRDFLKSAGALVIAFALPVDLLAEPWHDAAAHNVAAPDAQHLSGDPPLDQLDSWLAVGSDGTVTLFSGKVELGTGVETALSQIVAEELDIPVAHVRVVQGSTGRVPNQGSTTGSRTLQSGGVQVRRAAAQARVALLDLAAPRLGAPAAQLATANGAVMLQRDHSKSVSYGALVGNHTFHRTIDKSITPKHPADYTIVGTAVPRVELPEKITGTYRYTQNVRVPGMLHGRVIRPNAIGATLRAVDERSVSALPGNVKVVHRGNFLGVVAEREEQAIAAARALKATWSPGAHPLPEQSRLHEVMRAAPATERVITESGDVAGALAHAATTHAATYRTPYQSHASIGPSCAVADVRNGSAEIWSGTQGAYSLRSAIAALLQLAPEQVRVNWVEASGCYGHNGADDAAADAALLSQAVGKPVRVQWSRQDALGWDPKGPAMLIDVRGALDAQGRVSAWDYTVTTPTHSSRPRRDATNLLAGRLMGLHPRTGTVGGDRNARHNYSFPNARVAVRWLEHSVLRSSAMRGLGAPANVFANESFMDELAAAAHADPIEFRLRALDDPRAAAVIRRAAAMAQWATRPSPRTGRGSSNAASDAVATGRGIAFAQYENRYTYVATIAAVEVDRRSGVVRVPHVYVAHDCGLVVNPDGLRNQIEGGTIQGISRTLHEAVRFDHKAVTSVDWRSYPILTFTEVPETIEIALLDHPDEPAWGAGEPATCTVAGAIGNAIFDATGARLRDIPFTPERVKAALA